MTISEQQRVALSVEEAAGRLGVSRSLIWKMVNQGTIRTVRAGHRVLVPVSAVEEFLSASRS
jgi:excisionase family DNA binding protein